MKYVIIEDERFAYDEIRRMMSLLRPDYELAGWTTNIEQTTLMLNVGALPDLIIADIQLSDGLSIEAFRKLECDIPVIFTTAYDEYAINAFKFNSIDYLLKPIDEDELRCALEKFERHQLSTSLAASRLFSSEGAKHRFVLQSGDEFRHVTTDEIAYFYSEDKYTFAHLKDNHRHIINYTLDYLEQILPAEDFFRVSRSHIVSINAVVKSVKYFGGRLKLYLSPEAPQEVFVSRSRMQDFLHWLDK